MTSLLSIARPQTQMLSSTSLCFAVESGYGNVLFLQHTIMWHFDVVLAGTTKVKNLDNNIGSLGVKLTEDDLKEICDAVPLDEVNGSRDLSFLFEYNWKLADTPPKK